MTRQRPRVSICLPVFNGEHSLDASIESVLQQSFGDFELIIVDDCSTDNSLEIIKQHASKDDRIQLVRHNEKAGRAAGFNRGIEMARGECIKPFAQDALLHADMLSKLVGVLDRYPDLALVSTAATSISHKGLRVRSWDATPYTYFDSSSAIAGVEVIRKSLIAFGNLIGTPTAVMFRKQYGANGFDDKFHSYADLEYWFRILLNGKYLYLDEQLCQVRLPNESASDRSRQLIIEATALLKLGRRYKRFIWEEGWTHAEFNDLIIRKVASDLSSRQEPFKRSLLQFEPEFFAHFDQYVKHECLDDVSPGLLELAIQALLRVPLLAPDATHSDENVRELECSLTDHLCSRSWKLTRLLRELNRAFREDNVVSTEKSEGHVNYERYLRRQIRRIRQSRSWRITRPVRIVERWLRHATS